jgi:hypothetical protein
MYLQFAVYSLMDSFLSLGDFNFLDLPNDSNHPTGKYYLYDPELNFDERLHKRLAYLNYDSMENDILCAMWNVGALSPLPEQPRTFQAVNRNSEAGVSDKLLLKHVESPINVVFVSNNPYHLVNFQESMIVSYDRRKTLYPTYRIPVNYQNVGRILDIDSVNKRITTVGNIDFLSIGNTITIFNSTNNDGEYAITNVVPGINETVLTVQQNINSIVDGDIVKNNGTIELTSTVHLKDIEVVELNKLDTTSKGELTFLTVKLNMSYPIVLQDGGGGSRKIIKHIYLKTKPVIEIVQGLVMEQPYDEIIIE